MMSSAVESEAAVSRSAPIKRFALRWAHWAVPAALYFAGSFFIMARAWVRGPATHSLCACGDKALFLWMMEWPAHAIAHLQNPFFSTAAMHPHGVNLLDTTSVMGLSFPLVPITWLFGPVFSLNVALTLCPALSALAAYAFVRRFTRSWVVAMVGGSIYGFSAYEVNNLAGGLLMLTSAFVLPLIAICVDDLARTHVWPPVRVGIAIGILLFLQFFLSSEMTLLYAIGLSMACLLLITHNLLRDRSHLRSSLVGISCGAFTSGVLLCVPITYALLGPKHLSGPAWEIPTYILGNEWKGLVSYSRAPSPRWHWIQTTAGWFEQPLPPGAFLGWGVLGAAFIGLMSGLRRMSRWALVGAGLVAFLLSLGAFQFWALWSNFYRLPLLDSAIQGRLVVITILCVAVLASLGIEAVGRVTGTWIQNAERRDLVRRVATGVAGGVIVALPLAALWPSIPLGVRPITAPPWFAHHGAAQPPGTVILPNPPAFSAFEDALAWQALDGMRWSQPGIAGPQALPFRSGRQGPAIKILQQLSFGVAEVIDVSESTLTEVRGAVRRWHVSKVVVPSEFGAKAFSTAPAAAFYTAALGRLPTFSDGAWTWDITPQSWSVPPRAITKEQFTKCVSKTRPGVPLTTLPQCIMRRSIESTLP